MTLTTNNGPDESVVAPSPPSKTHRSGRWIEDWRPEDPDFWESTGAPIAKRNLIWSIFAEHLGFSVWLIWSVSSAYLLAQGFQFSVEQLFFLVAIPNLVGSLLRVPYTLAVPKFGGRNWTMCSAALLLIPTLGFAFAVTDPGTPYWVFCLIAATAGFGGGNFASSMANINFFFPADKKGAALGLNAAGGNLGVSIIQLFLPVIVGGAGIFGLVKASEGGIHLERAAWVYAGLAIVATLAAYFFMDNLATAKSNPREQLSVLKEKQTWIMSFLYIGTFGSFIGFSAAMPLLIKFSVSLQQIGQPGEATIELLPKVDELALNRRQAHHAGVAQAALQRAAMQDDPLLLAEELRYAVQAFAALTGMRATEAVLDDLFGRFCIGK